MLSPCQVCELLFREVNEDSKGNITIRKFRSRHKNNLIKRIAQINEERAKKGWELWPDDTLDRLAAKGWILKLNDFCESYERLIWADKQIVKTISKCETPVKQVA